MSILRSAVTFALAGAVPFLSACEDPAARQRADARAAIDQAAAELGLAIAGPVGGDPEMTQDTRQSLSRISEQLGEVARWEQAGDEQRAAAAILAAAAQRELTGMSLSHASEIESELRFMRARVASQAEAAKRLDALAQGTQESTVEPQQTQLSEQRAELQAGLQERNQQMEDLDQPITELRNLNEQEFDRVLALEEEALSLRRQASEQGYAAGLENFKLAVEREREADQGRYRVSLREIDLDFDFQPQYAIASRHAELNQTLLNEIDAANELLQGLESVNQAQTQQLQQTVGEFRSEIQTLLGTINEQMSGRLEELYREAEVSAEAAIQQASRAATHSRSDTSRLALARANELSGRLHWSRARGLADHTAVLEEIISAEGALGEVEPLRSALQEGQAKHEESMEKAQSAMQAAQEQLQQIGGGAGSQEIQAFRNNLQLSVAALMGEQFDSSTAAVLGAGSSGSSAGAGAQVAGASSPQELVSTLRSLDGLGDLATLISITAPPAQDPKLPAPLQGFVRTQIDMRRNLFALHEAVQSQFGREISEIPLFAGMEMGMFTMTRDAQLGPVTGDTAEIVLQLPQGMNATAYAVAIGDRWYLSSNTSFALMGQEMDLSSPEAAAGAEQMAQALQPLNESLRQLTQTVQSGGYSSFEEFRTAAEQQLMHGMGDLGEMNPAGSSGFMPQ